MASCIQHPYGVQPLGNAFLEANHDVILMRQNGLGKLAFFTDEILLDLLSFCSANDLANLNCCSRALYVYSMHSELWRDMMLRYFFHSIVYKLNRGQTPQQTNFTTTFATHDCFRFNMLTCNSIPV